MNRTSADIVRTASFAAFSIIAGVIGWFASFELLTEYIKTLRSPGYIPNCRLSMLVTCGPNMGSWEGSLFGFSNSIIGVAAFVAPVAVGVALLATARFAPWFWGLYCTGLLGGYVFIHWLAYRSIFYIGTLCPWCMVVWSVTIPLFVFTLLRALANGSIPLAPALRKRAERVYGWAWVIVALDYLLIAFAAQLRLDWFAELARALG